ncbi:type II toxin-antitoxin system PemK/MazF family toxin [Streptococcus equinus]|uniref:type II toxin-antitoxin system PemK/MazF family toxin n=1 Tax=Streptococcus equinus TaxID=1335 RepID=UPI003BF7E6B2
MTEQTDKQRSLNTWVTKKERIALDFFRLRSRMPWWEKEKGEIFWCELGENIGQEINKKRPVVVLSSSKRNRRLSHVTIAPITSTIKYKKSGDVTSGMKYPFHFLMKSNVYQFLDNDSVIKLEQLRTISKNRLDGCPIGQLSDEDLKIINKKISNFLDL